MTRPAARVTAQAKLNLGLRVLARETSGFHALETVFARITLGDELTVHVRDGERRVTCDTVDLGPPERNLAYRAAAAYMSATNWPPGFAIEIEKRVPVGGGLGGGSADAGAVLRALNALAPHPLGERELLLLAMTLGSDVPFLTCTAPTAIAWGRGERLLRIPPLPERHVVLVFPGFGISTGDAFTWLAQERGDYAPQPRLLGTEQFASWEAIAPLTENDFEPVIARRHPGLPGIVDGLRRAGATFARLTGSGSTVYGIFPLPPKLDALARAIPGEIVLTRTAMQVAPVEIIAAEG